MDQLDRDTGQHVKDAMEAAGVDVSQLAKQSGIRRKTLTRRLTSGGDFTLRELDAIAHVLNVPTEVLVPDVSRVAAQ